jgi:type IV secretion system protein VirD4
MWFFIKLGAAYRLTAGTNPALKIFGMTKTIGPEFANIAPGLNASDWMLGVIAAGIIRLMIYEKSKKAKNSERMWSTDRPAGGRKKTSSRL